MLYVYIVISAALIPLLNNFLPILRQSYSLWLVPLMFIGTLLLLIILHFAFYFMSLLFISYKRDVKALSFYRTMINLTVPLALKILRVKVTSEENEPLPQDKKIIMVCNHTHMIDPVMLMAAYPDLELSFMAKAEIKKQIPLIAKIIHSLGGVFVDRDNIRNSATSMIKVIKSVKSQKTSFGIFPEGHRTLDGKLQPFKEGAFKIAKKTDAPLAVVTLRGVTDILHNIPFKRTNVRIKVLKVFSPEETKELTAIELCEKAREIMIKDLGE